MTEATEATTETAADPIPADVDILTGEADVAEQVESLIDGEVHSSAKKEEPSTGEEAETPAPEEGGEETPEEKQPEEDSGKPPKGYVPHQALAEARSKVKEERQGRLALEHELAQLKAKQAELPEAAPDLREDDFKDFKMLSRDEFSELNLDDPVAAQEYLYNLDQYRIFEKGKQDRETNKAQAELAKKQAEAVRQEMIQTASAEMQEIVPDLFGTDIEAAKKMDESIKAFAEQAGMDRNSLAILTDPATEIIIRGDENRYILGPAASGLLKMIVTLQNKVQSFDPDVLRAAAEKDVEGKVTKTVAEKLKNSGGFQSLGDATPTAQNQLDSSRPLSENEWAALPAEERRRLLGGG